MEPINDPGRIDLIVGGAAIRIESTAPSQLQQVGGRPIIPASGETIDDEDVRSLRLPDRR